MNNFTKMLIAEKIPGIFCAVACMASVLIGFGVGYMVFGPIDEALAYADTKTVHQAGAPYYEAVNYMEYMQQEILCSPYAYDEALDIHLYVVKILDGYITVYYSEHNGGGIKVFTNIHAGALSREDQDSLIQGIRVYSEEELVRILQDYGS